MRAGAFSDIDHKTRFVGEPKAGEEEILFEIQDFIFNTGQHNTRTGYTFGIGYVRNNKYQIDLALVEANRFRWLVSSFLFRF